jgi:hypothetical protein
LTWARKRFIEAYVRYAKLRQDEYLLPAGEVPNLLAECAETKSVTRLLEAPKDRAPVPPPPKTIDMADARPIRETSRVIDLDGRRAELQRQAEIIKAKYANTVTA